MSGHRSAVNTHSPSNLPKNQRPTAPAGQVIPPLVNAGLGDAYKGNGHKPEAEKTPEGYTEYRVIVTYPMSEFVTSNAATCIFFTREAAERNLAGQLKGNANRSGRIEVWRNGHKVDEKPEQTPAEKLADDYDDFRKHLSVDPLLATAVFHRAAERFHKAHTAEMRRYVDMQVKVALAVWEGMWGDEPDCKVSFEREQITAACELKARNIIAAIMIKRAEQPEPATNLLQDPAPIIAKLAEQKRDPKTSMPVLRDPVTLEPRSTIDPVTEMHEALEYVVTHWSNVDAHRLPSKYQVYICPGKPLDAITPENQMGPYIIWKHPKLANRVVVGMRDLKTGEMCYVATKEDVRQYMAKLNAPPFGQRPASQSGRITPPTLSEPMTA